MARARSLKVVIDDDGELLVAIRALTAELSRQNYLAERSTTREMADAVSGELGASISRRTHMPGSGTLGRL